MQNQNESSTNYYHKKIKALPNQQLITLFFMLCKLCYFAFLHKTLNGIENALLYLDFKRRISREADPFVK